MTPTDNESQNGHDLIDYRLADLEIRVTEHGKQLDHLITNESRIETVLDRLDHTVASLDATVRTMQTAPAKRWEQIVTSLIIAAVSAVAAFVFGQMV